jgi:hypothetical protein
VIFAYSRWRRFSARSLADGVGVVVAILFVVATGRALASPGFALSDLTRTGLVVSETQGAQTPPDIFMVMLDGYPRSDILASWGYDNAWFTAALEERAFGVAAESHTNYPSTALVLATTFHMRHADEIEAFDGIPSQAAEQRRALRTALTDTPALRRLGELGYQTVAAGRPADYITLNTNRYLDDGWLNEFEHQILARSALSAIAVPAILSAKRGEVIATIEALPQVADDSAATFMFAHVVNPHLPFLFDRNGQVPQISCAACTFATHIDHSGLSRDAFHRAYVEQVHHLNGRIIGAIDQVIERSPDAVIILFSDHGSRAEREPDAEWYATLFAARTPGRTGVFPDDVRPIEIFPRLFGAYFGDEVPIPVDKDYLTPRTVQMPLEIIPRGNGP